MELLELTVNRCGQWTEKKDLFGVALYTTRIAKYSNRAVTYSIADLGEGRGKDD